jgi:hypothetical protein
MQLLHPTNPTPYSPTTSKRASYCCHPLVACPPPHNLPLTSLLAATSLPLLLLMLLQ